MLRREVVWLLGVAAAALVLGGCQVDATVDLAVGTDGSGQVQVRVELDDDAAAQVGGDLSHFLAADDLGQAGWVIEAGPRSVIATREVADAAEFNAALDDLTGSTGPFSTLKLEEESSFIRTTQRLSGAINLTAGLTAFGDEQLRTLTGSRTGIDLPPESLTLDLQATLAGQPSTTIALPLGQVSKVDMRSDKLNTTGLFAAATAALAALCLLAFAGQAVIRRRRNESVRA